MLNIVRQHQVSAPALVFVLAFAESLAFVSLLLPATAILLGVGGLIGAADIAFWPIWWAAARGDGRLALLLARLSLQLRNHTHLAAVAPSRPVAAGTGLLHEMGHARRLRWPLLRSLALDHA